MGCQRPRGGSSSGPPGPTQTVHGSTRPETTPPPRPIGPGQMNGWLAPPEYGASCLCTRKSRRIHGGISLAEIAGPIMTGRTKNRPALMRICPRVPPKAPARSPLRFRTDAGGRDGAVARRYSAGGATPPSASSDSPRSRRRSCPPGRIRSRSSRLPSAGLRSCRCHYPSD